MHAPPHPSTRRRGSVDKAMANRRSNNNRGEALASNRASLPNPRERQVGQFVLSKTLGEGTFGEVKLAVHKPTSERVAAKVRKLRHPSGIPALVAVGLFFEVFSAT